MQEDEQSLAHHRAALQAEWKKRSSNIYVIKDRMQRTFSCMRAAVKSISTEKLLRDYRALKCPEIMMQEVNEILSMDLRTMFVNSFLTKQTMLQGLIKKQHSEFKKRFSSIASEIEGIHMLSVLEIPSLFKEKYVDIFWMMGDDSDETSSSPPSLYPILAVGKDNSCFVYVDKIKVAACDDILTAFILIIASIVSP